MMYLNDGHNLKLIVIKYFKFVKCSLLRPHLKILLFSISILTDNLEHFIPFTNQTPINQPTIPLNQLVFNTMFHNISITEYNGGQVILIVEKTGLPVENKQFYYI